MTSGGQTMPIHTMAVAPDAPGMVDLTFRVPVTEVLGRSLADINSEGGLYGWSGWFQAAARVIQAEQEQQP